MYYSLIMQSFYHASPYLSIDLFVLFFERSNHTIDHSNFAQRIQLLRSTLGLSQSRFAQKIGRTASFIAKIELEKSLISEETLAQICSVYHVRREWLSSGKGDLFEPGYEQQPPDWDGLPNRIRSFRQEHGMTQSQLAAEVGCSKSQLTSVELGRVTPSDEWLERFCERFHIRKAWLLSGAGNQTAPTDKPENSLGTIYSFFRENDHARSVAMEAIAAYTSGRKPDVWEQLASRLNEESDID